MRPSRGVLAAAGVGLLAVLLPAAPASADDPSGAVTVTTTSVRTINAAKTTSVNVFNADITTATADEQRFVGTQIVVGPATARLFLGVVLQCTGPSGSKVQSMEAGRNVWPGSGTLSIPVGFVLDADVPGAWTCQTVVNVCDPGDCPDGRGSGRVPLVTAASGAKTHSLLTVSAALPSWAADAQIPGSKDVLVRPGRSTAATTSFDLSQASGPFTVGAQLSLTNCIVNDFPAACARAPKTAAQGSATATVSVRATQVAIQPGAACATAVATASGGAGPRRISWQQHHAVAVVAIPSFTLSSAAGCGTTIRVDVTVGAGRGGNSVVFEGGSKSRPTSVAYVVPATALAQWR